MKQDHESDGSTPENTPLGKIMGVVENRSQLKAVSDALSQLGIRDIEVLAGMNGANLSDSEQDTVAPMFMGDMEEAMVKQLSPSGQGRVDRFAAKVESEIATQAAETAKARGASEIVHFGSLVITNY